MCEGFCDNCRFAEWDYADAYGGGFSFVSGCKLWDNTELVEKKTKQLKEDEVEINEEQECEWGDTVECPYWEEQLYVV